MKITTRTRRMASAGIALATAAAATVAMATPASASYDQCPDGWFCMWENNAYTGYFYGLLNADSPNFGNDFNDKMTSYWNRSPDRWLVFSDSSYGGVCMTIEPGQSSSAVKPEINDTATSARRWVPSDVNKFCQF
ncbi:peptidase inhibitor family I36 protein [Amycolatopsis sacchari]|uniref:Peptidase inhibitor family I36 n=1 Tax=Amycolatopsis sacchari TaxID=115433 RepID=A0A1I3MWZ2_9PSEU|nr:peptidase inhibitor family I36 protein [Amycolatopsis sacchari]SFJ01300.1 Peptidase inhibitor family I36 [Amycolatopsis sacchari]